jgi:hypothetical protein
LITLNNTNMKKETFKGQCLAIVSEPLRVGAPIVIVGYKNKYLGEFLKPKTWLKFKKFAVVKNAR